MRKKRDVLRIGYKDYTVSFVSKFPCRGQVGECELAELNKNINGRIRIKKGMDDTEKVNTIIHEVLHAIWYTHGIGLGDQTEERVICAITNGLMAFIRDNPRYVIKLLRLALKK